MKSKKPAKKLLLSKTVVTNLQNKDMNTVKGGTSGITCEWVVCDSNLTCIRTCPY